MSEFIEKHHPSTRLLHVKNRKVRESDATDGGVSHCCHCPTHSPPDVRDECMGGRLLCWGMALYTAAPAARLTYRSACTLQRLRLHRGMTTGTLAWKHSDARRPMQEHEPTPPHYQAASPRMRCEGGAGVPP